MENQCTLSGNLVKLVPVAEENMDFICEEETNADLWCYEEQVETDKEKIRKIFTKNIGSEYRYDYVMKNSQGELAGACYIWRIDENRRSWEIGYVVLPQYRGKGYCKDSVHTLLRFAFSKLNAHKVIGMCNCENIASGMVMAKSGMSKQGVFRKEYLCHGKWTDQHYYSILDEDQF